MDYLVQTLCSSQHFLVGYSFIYSPILMFFKAWYLFALIVLLFIVAFLFNWIGFLLLMCFCHTIASRYGALAGFGLSLTKWTLIVKHSTDLASRENSWLWWLIMAFGLYDLKNLIKRYFNVIIIIKSNMMLLVSGVLICVRAIIQYLNIKRGWRLLSGSAQERLLFFY